LIRIDDPGVQALVKLIVPDDDRVNWIVSEAP
jgi:hypothetical protein